MLIICWIIALTKFLKRQSSFVKNSTSGLYFQQSIEGFVVVDERSIEGINVVNHCIFSFPELEQVVKFFKISTHAK